jgi:predicted transcriptional regulator
MAELPFELQRLPGSALDVLRYFGGNDNAPTDEAALEVATGLSSRGLGKAIKRLVTRKFAEMDIHRRYQLTHKGLQLMEELQAYDAETSSAPAEVASGTPPAPATTALARRMSVVVPEPLLANEPAKVYVGVAGGIPNGETALIVRISTINAELDTGQQTVSVAQGDAYTAFEVTPGEFTEVRLRLEVLQPDEFSGDITEAGGMYVDVDVTSNENEAGSLAAFGTDITIMA